MNPAVFIKLHHCIGSKVTAILVDQVVELKWNGSAINGATSFSLLSIQKI
jgi:hypothetical protein